jgi:uncharacterized membrane protein
MTFLNVFYFFIIYSFLGWVVETVFCSIGEKKFVNRGFLDGPFCPIYGTGALAVVFLVFPFHNNLLLFFIASIVITSIVEYFTSYFFEKFFNVGWWNYSDKPFNIHGRICLLYSIYWGILSVLALSIIHPKIIPISNFFSHYLGFYGVFLFIAYFIIDATDTFIDLLKFKNIIAKKIDHNLQLSKKIRRLTKSFPNFTSKINKDFIVELKSKLKKLS